MWWRRHLPDDASTSSNSLMTRGCLDSGPAASFGTFWRKRWITFFRRRQRRWGQKS
ncbi:MAG: hypothetical protein ACK56I_05115 [bacterium]